MTYTPPVISGYNSSPPPDDGSQVTANKIVWATIKSKLTDPIKNYIDSINTAVASGFAGLFLSSVDDKASTFTVGTSDDGKLFNCTSTLTANLPPAVDAGEGFKICLFNSSSGTITADGNSGELINGATTSTLLKQYDTMILVCTGTGWIAIKTAGLSFQSTTIASATSTDLGTSATNNVLISGTTTITGFGSTATTANPIYFIRFSGILTLTYNATSLIIPGSANITTAAGDTAIVEYLGSGNWRVLNYARFSGLAVTDPPPDLYRDRAYAEYLTNADIATAIPFDDTIPQVGEGTQILSVSITPKTTTNRIRLRFSGTGSTAGNNMIIYAIFANGAANAIAAGASYNATAAVETPCVLETELVPGSTSAQTYTVRVGPDTGTLRMNGTSAARRFGGVAKCVLIAEEITA